MTSFLSNYSLSLIANPDKINEQYHQSYKIIIALDSRFQCSIDGQVITSQNSLIVNKTILHSFTGSGNVLMVFIKPESILGWKLRDVLGNKACVNLEEILAGDQLQHIIPANYADVENQHLTGQIDAFLDSLLVLRNPSGTKLPDNWEEAVLKFIENESPDLEDLIKLAEDINLSPEQTSHLYADSSRAPLTEHVIWQRIRGVLSQAIAEESGFQDACLRSGFYGRHHFTKVVRQVFDLSPDDLIHHHRTLL